MGTPAYLIMGRGIHTFIFHLLLPKFPWRPHNYDKRVLPSIPLCSTPSSRHISRRTFRSPKLQNPRRGSDLRARLWLVKHRLCHCSGNASRSSSGPRRPPTAGRFLRFIIQVCSALMSSRLARQAPVKHPRTWRLISGAAYGSVAYGSAAKGMPPMGVPPMSAAF